ncbi:DUF262 domain-containing protein [Sphaerospermopsis sp. FACHB-1094]|nr:DUF262 domain-containing protein [Sphaerospermopsis sp. FACHB-1094]
MADQEIINNKYPVLQEQDRMKLPELVNKIAGNPNYMIIDESDNNWDIQKKSKLIESFIANFPVPPIIVSETTYCNNYKVIDGKQRIKAIVDYLKNRFPLTGLEFMTQLNGYTYDNLPANIERILTRRNLSVINILFDNKPTPEQIAKLLNIITERYK